MSNTIDKIRINGKTLEQLKIGELKVLLDHKYKILEQKGGIKMFNEAYNVNNYLCKQMTGELYVKLNTCKLGWAICNF